MGSNIKMIINCCSISVVDQQSVRSEAEFLVIVVITHVETLHLCNKKNNVTYRCKNVPIEISVVVFSISNYF